MADKHELENLMRSTMENLRDMIDVNTVVGDSVPQFIDLIKGLFNKKDSTEKNDDLDL